MAFPGSRILSRLIEFRKAKPETRHVTKLELQIRYAQKHEISQREAKRTEDFNEAYLVWKSPRPPKGTAEYQQRRSAWFRAAIDMGFFERVDGKWRYVG